DNGPPASGVTNHFFQEHVLRLDLELRGQGTYRRAAAGAALSRAEWDVASQEVTVAVATIRAFNAVLYRDDKQRVLEGTVRLNEKLVAEVPRLVRLGRLRAADLVLARTEADAARALRGQGKLALDVARAELRRQLGIIDDTFVLRGSIGVEPPPAD